MSQTLRNKVHLMVDLETLGIETSSVIASVGIAMFTIDGGIINSHQWILNAPEQIKNGRTVCASTLHWWMQQSPEAQKDILQSLSGECTTNYEQFCSELFNLCGVEFGVDGKPKHKRELQVWAHGPHFDIAKLEHMFWSIETGVSPWMYSGIRDTRTIYDAYDYVQKSRVGVYHRAEDDAITQAENVIAAVKSYNG